MNRSRLAPALLCAVLLAGVALGACSTTSGGTPVTLSTTTTAGATDAGPTTSTTAEPDASEGKELFVYAPEEGDCIDLRATGDQGATTTRALPDANATPQGSKELILRLDCNLPHQYEVIAVVPAGLPGTPDEPALDRRGQAAVPAGVRRLRGHAVPGLVARGGLGPAERGAAGPQGPADRLPRLRPRRQAGRLGPRLRPLKPGLLHALGTTLSSSKPSTTPSSPCEPNRRHRVRPVARIRPQSRSEPATN